MIIPPYYITFLLNVGRKGGTNGPTFEHSYH
jgi:hypothetical protein